MGNTRNLGDLLNTDSTIATADVADGGITTAKLADTAVTTAKITDANITTAKLASNAVTTAKITDGNISTAKLADDAVTGAKIENNPTIAGNLTVSGGFIPSTAYSNRNIIINGNMQVAQRATSKAVTASGTFVCDRWGIALSSDGRFTMSQASITDLEGFGKATKLDCTTADTSIASDELLLFYQRFEGQFLQRMQKGFSSAKPVTLSFYVKGNASATYVAELIDSDNSNRHINKSFSVTTSWSRVSLTFPGDTTGKITADNSASLYLHIWLHAGSNYQGGTLQTSWGSLVSANRAVGISSFFDSTDREFFITGIQMEVGEVATPFEHESFGDNLARCQRYFFAPHKPGDPSAYMGQGHYYRATTVQMSIHHPTTMRASPTVTSIDATDDFSFLRENAIDTMNNLVLSSSNTHHTMLYNDSDVSGTIGHAGAVLAQDNTNAFVHLSAEL